MAEKGRMVGGMVLWMAEKTSHALNLFAEMPGGFVVLGSTCVPMDSHRELSPSFCQF